MHRPALSIEEETEAFERAVATEGARKEDGRRRPCRLRVCSPAAFELIQVGQEFGRCKDANPTETTERKQVVVTGDHHVDRRRYGAFQDPIVVGFVGHGIDHDDRLHNDGKAAKSFDDVVELLVAHL